jgi:hypothetical protein
VSNKCNGSECNDCGMRVLCKLYNLLDLICELVKQLRDPLFAGYYCYRRVINHRRMDKEIQEKDGIIR